MSQKNILPRVVVARVGWMTYYAGVQNERPIGGGSYNIENVGYESCNFVDLDGQLHGYVHIKSTNSKINLKRIDPDVKTGHLDNVLVIFAATNPDKGGQWVVGWYKNASVYWSYQEEIDPRRSFDGEYFGYFFEAPISEAVLLPLDQRTLPVPRKKGGMIRTSIFYGRDENGRPRTTSWLHNAVDFVERYNGPNLLNDELDEAATAAVKAAEAAQEAGHGQGFAGKEVRQAVEQRAMEVVRAHFEEEEGWTLEDTSATKPYDYVATKGKEKFYIEVKGTRSSGSQVFLTKNEVRWARTHKRQTILAVVTGITIAENNGKIEAGQGQLQQVSHWPPEDDRLEPLTFSFTTGL